jgi:hypothetical protein
MGVRQTITAIITCRKSDNEALGRNKEHIEVRE